MEVERKMKEEEDTQMADVLDDVGESPVKTPKQRRRKGDDDATASPATPATKKRRTTKKGKAAVLDKADLDCLVNQEDDPVPVDGAPLEVVEAEEHPEVLAAVVEGQDLGCAKKTSKGKGKRRTKAAA